MDSSAFPRHGFLPFVADKIWLRRVSSDPARVHILYLAPFNGVTSIAVQFRQVELFWHEQMANMAWWRRMPVEAEGSLGEHISGLLSPSLFKALDLSNASKVHLEKVRQPLKMLLPCLSHPYVQWFNG